MPVCLSPHGHTVATEPNTDATNIIRKYYVLLRENIYLFIYPPPALLPFALLTGMQPVK